MPITTEFLSSKLTGNQLNLHEVTLSLEDISILCSFLKTHDVQKLDLHANQMTQAGIRALAEGLKESNVRAFILTGNKIGDEGVKTLAAVLRDTKIQELNLSFNSIGHEGVKALASVLRETHVETLVLCRNCIGHNYRGEEGVTALADGLKGSKVQTLNLRDAHIHNSDVRAIASLRNTNVRTLNLSKNLIDKRGIQDLIPSLIGSNLQIIDLTSILRIDRELIEAFINGIHHTNLIKVEGLRYEDEATNQKLDAALQKNQQRLRELIPRLTPKSGASYPENELIHFINRCISLVGGMNPGEFVPIGVDYNFFRSKHDYIGFIGNGYKFHISLVDVTITVFKQGDPQSVVCDSEKHHAIEKLLRSTLGIFETSKSKGKKEMGVPSPALTEGLIPRITPKPGASYEERVLIQLINRGISIYRRLPNYQENLFFNKMDYVFFRSDPNHISLMGKGYQFNFSLLDSTLTVFKQGESQPINDSEKDAAIRRFHDISCPPSKPKEKEEMGVPSPALTGEIPRITPKPGASYEERGLIQFINRGISIYRRLPNHQERLYFNQGNYILYRPNPDHISFIGKGYRFNISLLDSTLTVFKQGKPQPISDSKKDAALKKFRDTISCPPPNLGIFETSKPKGKEEMGVPSPAPSKS